MSLVLVQRSAASNIIADIKHASCAPNEKLVAVEVMLVATIAIDRDGVASVQRSCDVFNCSMEAMFASMIRTPFFLINGTCVLPICSLGNGLLSIIA